MWRYFHPSPRCLQARQVSTPSRGTGCFLLHGIQTDTAAPQPHTVYATGALSQGLKTPQREADHSLQLVPKRIMRKAVLQIPHIRAWLSRGQLHLFAFSKAASLKLLNDTSSNLVPEISTKIHRETYLLAQSVSFFWTPNQNSITLLKTAHLPNIFMTTYRPRLCLQL
jgi:hypothetical protein